MKGSASRPSSATMNGTKSSRGDGTPRCRLPVRCGEKIVCGGERDVTPLERVSRFLVDTCETSEDWCARACTTAKWSRRRRREVSLRYGAGNAMERMHWTTSSAMNQGRGSLTTYSGWKICKRSPIGFGAEAHLFLTTLCFFTTTTRQVSDPSLRFVTPRTSKNSVTATHHDNYTGAECHSLSFSGLCIPPTAAKNRKIVPPFLCRRPRCGRFSRLHPDRSAA